MSFAWHLFVRASEKLKGRRGSQACVDPRVNEKENDKWRRGNLAAMTPASPRTLAPLVAGAALIVLGTAIITGAREIHTQPWGYDNIDGMFVYITWDATQLAAGILSTVVGTASVVASLTYLILSRNKKGV